MVPHLGLGPPRRTSEAGFSVLPSEAAIGGRWVAGQTVGLLLGKVLASCVSWHLLDDCVAWCLSPPSSLMGQAGALSLAFV